MFVEPRVVLVSDNGRVTPGEHIVARDRDQWLVVAQRYGPDIVVMARCENQKDAEIIAGWLNFPSEQLESLLRGLHHLADSGPETPAAGVQGQLEGLAAIADEVLAYLKRVGRSLPND